MVLWGKSSDSLTNSPSGSAASISTCSHCLRMSEGPVEMANIDQFLDKADSTNQMTQGASHDKVNNEVDSVATPYSLVYTC